MVLTRGQMAAIDSAQKKAEAAQKTLEKELQELEDLLTATPIDKDAVELQLVDVESEVQNFLTFHTKFADLLVDNGKDAEHEAQQAVRLQLQKRKNRIGLKAAKIMTPAAAASSSTTSSTASGSAVSAYHVKLPRRELPKFDGDVRKWRSFEASFREIDADATVPAIEKFNYLLQAMVPDSKAEKVVSSFPAAATSYQLAMKELEDRFGRKNTLIKVYVRDLIDLMDRARHKKEMDLCDIVTSLHSQILNLEQLGVTKDKFGLLLYPMIESSLPPDVMNRYLASQDCKEELEDIMEFLKREVRRLEETARAQTTSSNGDNKKQGKSFQKSDVPTTSALFVANGGDSDKIQRQCIFCGGNRHKSQQCNKGKAMSPKERTEVLKRQQACFTCLKQGHRSSECPSVVECSKCKGKHFTLMCRASEDKPQSSRMMMVPSSNQRTVNYAVQQGMMPFVPQQQFPVQQQQQLPVQQQQFVAPSQQVQVNPGGPGGGRQLQPQQQQQSSTTRPSAGFSNISGKEVVLLTFVAVVETDFGPVRVRIFVDPGSQESYVETLFAESARLKKVSSKEMNFHIFGAQVTKPARRDQYEINIRSLDGAAAGTFVFNAVPKIAVGIEKPPPGRWYENLATLGIQLTDQSGFNEEIQLLIGMDIEAQIVTGGFKRLDPFPYVRETIFGWMVGGSVPKEGIARVPYQTTTAHMVTSMMVSSFKEEDLWSLETLGIMDEAKTQTREDLEAAALAHFKSTVSRLPDGRYEVGLPWIEGHQQLVSNKRQALARLSNVTNALKKESYWNDYDDIIKGWEHDGIVELVQVAEQKVSPDYFLPHRHVVKQSSTTPVRPVFDPSSKVKGSRSLNACLEKGPEWLRRPETEWPSSSATAEEDEVMAEVRKTVVSALVSPVKMVWERLERFSSYHTQLRIVSYVLRYLNCLKTRAAKRKNGTLERLQQQHDGGSVEESSAEEIVKAEECFLRHLQQTSFSGVQDKRLRDLDIFVDDKGLIRAKTQLYFGCSNEDQRCPIVLPPKHWIVAALILAEHDVNSHPGVSTLMAKLRSRYWILKCRRTVSSVIGKCLLCRRFAARRCEVPSAPLPKERVTAGVAFGVTGVDLLGPLFLFGGEKVWVVLYTCAVYRCVHLEVTPTLSTEGFLLTLRRFVARRGRPARIYSDNGLNFVGCQNLFKKVDWGDVKRYAAVRRMDWIFNPPTASWWGGWWERLVGLTKVLLRRVLGKRVVSLDKLVTVLCEVEDTLNQRPLSYISEQDNLVPLCPAMFLRDNSASGLPEAEAADAKALRGSARRVQHLREQLRSRIVKEYLGQLRHVAGSKCRSVNVGDVVLIEVDEKKRIDWPWGVVQELYPGRDGRVRKVSVKTKDGDFLRPVQRLFLLETSLSSNPAVEVAKNQEEDENVEDDSSQVEETPEKVESVVKAGAEVVTRAGRKVKKPARL